MNTSPIDISSINFDKLNGLVPACIQDFETMQVLMTGFMNPEALQQTLESGQVTFYSRTKNRLWTKGETSGHFLKVVHLLVDCDQDSLLIFATRTGPACHTGSVSCYDQNDVLPPAYWLAWLPQIIQERQETSQNSYTNQLLASGLGRMAQKVGEEAVEVVIAALSDTNEAMTGEVVDLLYHLFVLLSAKKISMAIIAQVIRDRSCTSS